MAAHIHGHIDADTGDAIHLTTHTFCQHASAS